MIGFLNERSLGEYGDWCKSLRIFLEIAQELLNVGALLLKDSRFFVRPEVIQRFNSISFPKDERALIRSLVFGNRYYRCWTEGRLSVTTENYICLNPALNLLDESLSEAAERKIVFTTEDVGVLSADDSSFHTEKLIISKSSSGESVELSNATSVDHVMKWIVSQRGYYNLDSRSAPRDFQTVLMKDSSRFRATGKVERRFCRQVFEEMATGRFYYVDDAHPGNSAHLEVFSAQGDHLGTADINRGDLNTEGRVVGRILRL